MIEDLFAFLFGLAVGMVIGFLRATNYWSKHMLDHPEILNKVLKSIRQTENLPKGKEELMTFEKYGEIYYAFTEGGDFLAQANTPSDLMDLIQKRFPDRVFRCTLDKDKAKEMGIIQ